MTDNTVLDKPSSEGGWSDQIITLDNATVVPPLVSDFIQPAGLLDSDGTYCPHGALWRKFRPITTEPKPPEGPVKQQTGRWLWGGILWTHFGHFLAESTSRLWALDYLDQPVDGILFMPKRPRNQDNLKAFHQPFFDAMGMDLPFTVATEPLSVEQLVVPGQGFGLGEISAGTERFRNSALGHLGEHIAADGPEKLYISRSELGFTRGSILGEQYLEDRLADEGYTIFHPQQHPIDVQVAHYKAARRIVATDGSALHLLAMVGRKDQDIAVIARRQSSAVDFLVRHIEHFTGSRPTYLTELKRNWYPEGRKQVKRLSVGELDLPAVGAGLEQAGFIADGAGWENLPDGIVQHLLDSTGQTWQMPTWLVRKLARQEQAASRPN